MRLQLDRLSSDADSTIGNLYVDGAFFCVTCEDEYRLAKLAKETRIPAGVYTIRLRAEGGFHQRYLAKFGPDFHKGMLHLQDVPGFEYILIHVGNTDEDTEGCILVGLTANLNEDGGGTIANSVAAYKKLYPVVRDALLRGDDVFISITDKDRG